MTLRTAILIRQRSLPPSPTQVTITEIPARSEHMNLPTENRDRMLVVSAALFRDARIQRAGSGQARAGR
jgi:hypothetical protein